MILLCAISRAVKFMETEGASWLPGAGERGPWELFKGDGVSVLWD